MRYFIDNEARIKYQKNGFVQIADLLTKEEIQQLIASLKGVMSRKERSSNQVFQSICEKKYILGRDVSRDDTFLKKFTRSSVVRDIFSEIAEKRDLRLAFDQAVILQEDPLFNYKTFFSIKEPLNPITSRFCIQGLESICIYCLDYNGAEANIGQIIPCRPGDAVFIDAKTEIDLKEIFEKTPGIFYIIGLGNLRSVYVHNPLDPCLHTLKDIGYSYGDVLKEKWHPKVM